MLLNPLTLHLPKTSREAARLYKELEDSKVLAGGTFLLNSMKLLKTKGTKTHRNILSLAHVDELKGVTLEGDTLIIKAMTRINDLLDAYCMPQYFNQSDTQYGNHGRQFNLPLHLDRNGSGDDCSRCQDAFFGS